MSQEALDRLPPETASKIMQGNAARAAGRLASNEARDERADDKAYHPGSAEPATEHQPHVPGYIHSMVDRMHDQAVADREQRRTEWEEYLRQ